MCVLNIDDDSVFMEIKISLDSCTKYFLYYEIFTLYCKCST